jgi:co-chaperonin GroES (HSP10)
MNQRILMNSADFKVCKESVLVEYNDLEKEEKTESGLVVSLARSSLERQTQGLVLSVGDGIEWIVEGDLVVWENSAGVNLDFDDRKCLLLGEKSILGKKKV